MSEPRPPPKECLICTSDALIYPERAEIPLSNGGVKRAWRYHCAVCSATRYEPAREKDVPGMCDERGGPPVV
jgi:hypothetical protein